MNLCIKADTPADVIEAMLDYCKHMHGRAVDHQVGATTVKDGQRWRGEVLAYLDMMDWISSAVIEPKDSK